MTAAVSNNGCGFGVLVVKIPSVVGAANPAVPPEAGS